MPRPTTKRTGLDSAPDVFLYHDYRVFLRDWFNFQKQQGRGFSLRRLCSRARLASGYLPMVLSGKRNLSSKALEKLTPFLGLSAPQLAYLDQLKELNDAHPGEAQREAFEALQKNRTYQSSHPREMEAYRYLTHWYYVAIRELALLPGFRADPAWIQSRLRTRVSLKEIQDAVEFLLNHGFLERDSEGGVHVAKKEVDCLGGVFRLALGNFHRQMLALAADSLLSIPRDERSIEGFTLPLLKKDFPKVVGILKEAFEAISKLEKSEALTSEIYHVVLGAFPLTQRKKVQQEE